MKQRFTATMPWLYMMLVALLAGCVTAGHDGFSRKARGLAHEIRVTDPTAVSWIYDAKTGDVTALGNLWRDRVEKAFRDNGRVVTARQDIAALIDEVESFGFGAGEKDIWEKAGAAVVACGKYRILPPEKQGNPHRIALAVKAFRVSDGSLVQAFEWVQELDHGWPAMASVVPGNVYHEKLETLTDTEDTGDNPRLSACLDRQPPCYPAGAEARVSVTTESGVHLYILNLAADRTVTLLYPNRRLPDQPLAADLFEFPPAALAREMQLVFYPLKSGQPCQEAVKVVASRTSLDFSFLPVPVNRLYAGAEGGDIKKMLAVLRQAGKWREVTLNYVVGPGCE